MSRFLFRFALQAAMAVSVVGVQAAAASQTTYTLPNQVHWIPDTGKGAGSFYAMIRGRNSDRCDNLVRVKFPAGFIYPWHTNQNSYAIYTVLQGTLAIGFDKHYARSAERLLPAGAVMQGLGSEPHYGRAIGLTIFDVYTPCFKR
jgi:hypothetical protein